MLAVVTYCKQVLRYLLPLTGLQLLLACHTNRQLSRQSVVVNSESEVTTTVTERIDTTVVIKADSLKGSVALDDLLKGKGLYEENEHGILVLRYDSVTGRIRAKAIRKEVAAPVQLHKTTTLQARSKSSAGIKTRLKDSQTSMGLNTTNLWLLIGLMVLAVGWYALIVFRKKKPETQERG